ncbi:hypothetical protein TNCV_1498681 [Trichonephila clavipes]|nr:hypothetical protein TNCV_1498681 [Trichonephila clavipes]
MPLGLGSNSGKGMDVSKCMSLRQGGTLNSRRVASPLVRLVEGEGILKSHSLSSLLNYLRAFGNGPVAGVPGGQGIESWLPYGHGYELVSSVRALVPQKFSVEEELMHVKHVEVKSPHVGVM